MNQQGHQKRHIVLGPVYMEEGGHQIGEVTCGGSPHLSCKCDHIKVRDYIIWTGGLPQLPGVPHLHVNRPLNWEVEWHLPPTPHSPPIVLISL